MPLPNVKCTWLKTYPMYLKNTIWKKIKEYFVYLGDKKVMYIISHNNLSATYLFIFTTSPVTLKHFQNQFIEILVSMILLALKSTLFYCLDIKKVQITVQDMEESFLSD